MTSTSKKFSLNFTRTLNFKRRIDGSQEQGISSSRANRTSSVNRKGSNLLSPASDVSCGLAHSSSTGDLFSPGTTPLMSPDMDTDSAPGDTVMLSQRVLRCSSALTILKNLISRESSPGGDTSNWDEVHRGLEEVLTALREIVNNYPALESADLLELAAGLIAKVKECSLDSTNDNVTAVAAGIDALSAMLTNRCMQLAQNAIAEILVVDTDQSSSNLSKAKSLDCLNNSTGAVNSGGGVDESVNLSVPSGTALDDVLRRLENGVEMALHRTQSWSKFAKDLVSYIEKRTALWTEFARNLTKIAKSLQQSINEDSYLPFHSVFSTAVCQEEGMLALIVAARTAISSQVVISPLNARRVEHDKLRKNLKYTWTKQVNKMHDAVSNLCKAKSLYVSRHQEYDKVKEQALKAESDTQGTAAGNLAKAEKKKKQEDDALQKAVEAEAAYKACIVAANSARHQLECVKTSVLREVRELIVESDRVLKLAVVGYFQVMHESAITVPLQYRALCEASQLYDPGSHYANYIRHIRPSDSVPAVIETFVFEPYISRFRESSGSLVMDTGSYQDKSGLLHTLQETSKWLGGNGTEDGESDNGSIDSDESMESSPSASPYQSHHQTLKASASAVELANLADEDNNKYVGGDGVPTYRGIRLSIAAQTHTLRKLHTPSRCAECDQYVYFQGAECELCGAAVHKKCLEILRCACDRQQLSPSSRPLSSRMGGRATDDEVPYLVKKCIAEIDIHGLTVKGIYRLSGVKSKVEQLCQSFETDERSVDLSDVHPNVITNVLKLYFRQLPEPLLSFNLYPQLISLAREELQGNNSTSNTITSLSQFINQLPKRSRRTLSVLVKHLNRVAKNQDSNQMSSSNLGIIFGPTLLRPREGASSLNYLIETPFQTRIVELLIDNVEVIFGNNQDIADGSAANTTSVTATTTNAAAAAVTAAAPVDADVGCLVMRSNLGRLSTGDFQPEMTSPSIASWYAPQTQDLLLELAKEEPRFQRLQDPTSTPQQQQQQQQQQQLQQTQQQQQLQAASVVPVCTDDVMTNALQAPTDEQEKIIFI